MDGVIQLTLVKTDFDYRLRINHHGKRKDIIWTHSSLLWKTCIDKVDGIVNIVDVQPEDFQEEEDFNLNILPEDLKRALGKVKGMYYSFFENPKLKNSLTSAGFCRFVLNRFNVHPVFRGWYLSYETINSVKRNDYLRYLEQIKLNEEPDSILAFYDDCNFSYLNDNDGVRCFINTKIIDMELPSLKISDMETKVILDVDYTPNTVYDTIDLASIYNTCNTVGETPDSNTYTTDSNTYSTYSDTVTNTKYTVDDIIRTDIGYDEYTEDYTQGVEYTESVEYTEDYIQGVEYTEGVDSNSNSTGISTKDDNVSSSYTLRRKIYQCRAEPAIGWRCTRRDRLFPPNSVVISNTVMYDVGILIVMLILIVFVVGFALWLIHKPTK